jgi:hypothetical protein
MVILCYQLMDQVLKMVLIGFVTIQLHVLFFQLIFVKLIEFLYHHRLVDFLHIIICFLLLIFLGYHGEFQWDKYLLETNSVYAPKELFQIIKVNKFNNVFRLFLFNFRKNKQIHFLLE